MSNRVEYSKRRQERAEKDAAYWQAKFEQEERLRDAPKLMSTVMEPARAAQKEAKDDE